MALTVAPALTRAQAPVVPTRAQVELYESAHSSFERGDHAGATRLLRSALALGELNILYVSLGRALFRTGSCEEADAAYAQALTAPAVANPSPDAIATRVTAYREDLRRQCPGRLVVHCQPAGVRIQILGQASRSCDGEPILLPPGRHVVRASLGERRSSQAVAVEPMETTVVELAVEVPAPVAPAPPPPEDSEGSAQAVLGFTAAGVGVAVLGASLIMDVVVLGAAIDDFDAAAERGDPDAPDLKADVERLQGITLAGYALGGVLLAGGVILLLTTPDDDGADATPAVGAFWLPGGGGANLRMRF